MHGDGDHPTAPPLCQQEPEISPARGDDPDVPESIGRRNRHVPRAQRFAPSGAAATCPAIALAPVAARADEHLAPASGTQKQSGIVHCSPRRGGLDDPRLRGNTALGAVRQCGSGRSLGRDRQVSAVRGCVSLLVDSDLTPTHERRHRRCARCACAMGRQHRLRRETTTRPRRAPRDDSEQVRSDRYSQFTWPVRQITGATRQGWSRRKGVCDDFMKPCSSSSGCESRPAKGEPARVGSEPCAGTGNGSGDA